uniref:Uncharacterized protein n=1 Tax=Psilocybe cubensis TaxID=181762 RepID=A0A8H8CEI0_PSICU
MFFVPRRRLTILTNGRMVLNGPFKRQVAPSASIHISQARRSDKHTSDSYAKDVDDTPPADNSVHRMDPDSDRFQKPHEPPSGPWSRAGVQTEEYRHVEGEKQPYAAKGTNQGRYGSRMNWTEDKGPETSGGDEGPDAKSSGGRKA